MIYNGKALLAGRGEENRPGSIQIFKCIESKESSGEAAKIEKVNEIQAHSKPIERMKLSFDNQNLFTVGQDCCLIVYDVKDRDPKSKFDQRDTLPSFSDEILTEKNESEQINQEIEQLKNEAQGSGPDGNFERMLQLRKQEEKITQQEEQLANIRLNHSNKYDTLAEHKSEKEKSYEDQIRQLTEQF